MSAHSVTLNLPENVYERARRTASILNRSVEELLESTLDTALPAFDDAPTHLETDMARLPSLNDTELWQVARSKMDKKREKTLHKLLDAQAERRLNEKETRQLESLHHESGKLTLLKSQAYALLHQRGYPVPQP